MWGPTTTTSLIRLSGKRPAFTDRKHIERPTTISKENDNGISTRDEKEGETAAGTLDDLAKFLGIEGKTAGMDGSQVFDYWQAGRVNEVAEYCRRDVELTRNLWAMTPWSAGCPSTPWSSPGWTRRGSLKRSRPWSA